MAQRHSATVDALIDVSQRLTDAQFPPHPSTGRIPKTGTDNDRIGPADEWIDLDVSFDDGTASVAWARIGAGAVGRRDEAFWVDVGISSTVPGKSRMAILERLRDLQQVVEDLFYDPSTGAPLLVGEGYDWFAPLGGVSMVLPAAWRTDQGWVGSSLVRIAVAARI